MAAAKKPEPYVAPEYSSQYQGQLETMLGNIINREEFTYDPLKDANYQALASIYQKKGDQAREQTLGDASALTGGRASSYAVSAASQAQSDYNQQFAALVPSLQEAAYGKYIDTQNMNMSAYEAVRTAEDSNYNKYRDDVSDSQWQYGMDYQNYRDDVSDSQRLKDYNRGIFESDRAYDYQKGRDKVTDNHWQKEYNLSRRSVSGSGGSGSGGDRRYPLRYSSEYINAKDNANRDYGATELIGEVAKRIGRKR